jgi:hypothetical protein
MNSNITPLTAVAPNAIPNQEHESSPDKPSTSPSGTIWSRLPGPVKPLVPWLLGGVVAVLLLIWAAAAMVSSQMRGAEAAAVGVATATKDTAQAIGSASKALSGIFGGTVIINSTGTVLMPREIAQLAVTEAETKITSRLTSSYSFGWFPATLEIEGQYRALLGIDLEKVIGHFDPATLTVELELPPAQVLAVETVSVERTRQDGWWVNRLGSEEAVDLFRRNRETAGVQLDREELRRRADYSLRKRLSASCSSAGVILRVKEPWEVGE